MTIANWYELSSVFNEEDFVYGAAVFFHHLQYTEQMNLISHSKEAERWVYHLLGYDVSLSKEELLAIRQIKMAGEIDPIHFSDNDIVHLFAIELHPWACRSQVAYTIHKLLAQNLKSLSTILFCQNKDGKRECLLSIDMGIHIILSDWFSIESEVTPLLAVQGSYLSSQSAEEFQKDLAYGIGRSYYHTPDTPALIKYSLLQYASRAYLEEYGRIDWDKLQHDVDILYLAPMREYGDDYIEPPSKEEKKEAEDIDFTMAVISNSFDEEEKLDEVETNEIEGEVPRQEDEIDQLLKGLGDDFDDPEKLLKAITALNGSTKTEDTSTIDILPKEPTTISQKPIRFTQIDEKEEFKNDDDITLESGLSESQAENVVSDDEEIHESILVGLDDEKIICRDEEAEKIEGNLTDSQESAADLNESKENSSVNGVLPGEELKPASDVESTKPFVSTVEECASDDISMEEVLSADRAENDSEMNESQLARENHEPFMQQRAELVEIEERLSDIQKRILDLQERKNEKEIELAKISKKNRKNNYTSGFAMRLKGWVKNPWKRKSAMQANVMLGEENRLSRELDDIMIELVRWKAEEKKWQTRLEQLTDSLD